jgi:hypothetical protein
VIGVDHVDFDRADPREVGAGDDAAGGGGQQDGELAAVGGGGDDAAERDLAQEGVERVGGREDRAVEADDRGAGEVAAGLVLDADDAGVAGLVRAVEAAALLPLLLAQGRVDEAVPGRRRQRDGVARLDFADWSRQLFFRTHRLSRPTRFH